MKEEEKRKTHSIRMPEGSWSLARQMAKADRRSIGTFVETLILKEELNSKNLNQKKIMKKELQNNLEESIKEGSTPEEVKTLYEVQFGGMQLGEVQLGEMEHRSINTFKS